MKVSPRELAVRARDSAYQGHADGQFAIRDKEGAIGGGIRQDETPEHRSHER